jgi:hypothetical protein
MTTGNIKLGFYLNWSLAYEISGSHGDEYED